VKRLVVIVVGVTAFLAVCVVVARWLSADTDERGQVVELLRAQSRGDVDGMLRLLRCRDRACIAVVRANARRLRGHGDLKIPLYESGTAHALRSRTKQTRVVWFTPGRLTTVQCVLVRRTGNVFAGTSVSLLRLSAPIGRQSSCP
jgi:G:T/U-mismatch repair DNA glycosylase